MSENDVPLKPGWERVAKQTLSAHKDKLHGDQLLHNDRKEENKTGPLVQAELFQESAKPNIVQPPKIAQKPSSEKPGENAPINYIDRPKGPKLPYKED